MKINIKIIKTFYLVLLGILFLFIISTPLLITEHLHISDSIIIEEEYTESILIVLLIIFSFIIYSFYLKELVKKNQELKTLIWTKNNVENKLDDAFKYIGAVNIQIQEIRSIFSAIKKFPENKKDFKNIINFLAEKTLGIIKADWITFRIIDPLKLRVFKEYSKTRADLPLPNYLISNKDLLNDSLSKDYYSVSSDFENFNLKVFCLMPAIKPTEEQKILIKAIVNELGMLFLIFHSQYYKK